MPDEHTSPEADLAAINGKRTPKRRSLSFGSGLKLKDSRSSDNKSDSGSISGAGGNGGGRMRVFFASLAGSKKKQSASSLSSDAKAASSSTNDEPAQLDNDVATVAQPPPSSSLSSLRLATIPQGGSEILMERSTSSRTEIGLMPVDPFRQAVLDAETAIDKLQTAYTVLSSLSQLASVAQELLPGVGAAVGIVANMVKSAKTVAVNKVAALRLVERCATILLAVQQAMIDTNGQLGSAMRVNIERLLSNLHKTAQLLSRIAVKPFFEQYFKADEYARLIAKSGEDLSDFVQIFQLQTQINVGAWRQQMVEDREKDVAMLTGRLQDILDRGGDIIRSMEIQREQQQEAIAALQRRVDQIATLQLEEMDRHHPDSPSLRLLDDLPPLPPAPSEGYSTLGTENGGLGLDIPSAPQASVFQGSPDAHGQVRDPDPIELQRKTSTGHREFEEKALAALRRVSGDTEAAVPDWVITFLEVSREERIKTGFFSEVWRGTWQGQVVAIKMLSPTADKALFIKEVDVWRRLRSPHILPFYGASSTTGPPPWMLISPYMRNGNIIDYIQTPHGRRCDKFTMIHQIALGMDYLMSRDILHGDLKASNILVNDAGDIHICDFGLSQLKTDMKRKSQTPASDTELGTLRWQSPERLKGGRLSWKCDVYSFAMVIYEIFSDGAVPFGQVDDRTFRRDILKGLRPARPDGMPEKVWRLTARCWAQDVRLRPKFSAISKEIEGMYTPRASLRQQSIQTISTDSTENETAWATASEGEPEGDQHVISPVPNLLVFPESEDSSSASSLRSIPSHLEHEPTNESDRAEKHYRHYLSHEFDDRLSVALWFPSPVSLGSVGYIRHGQFVKLLDAHSPPVGMTTLPPTPYIDEFSSLQVASTPINVRSGLEKNLDRFVAWTKFTKSSGETAQKPIARHIDFPLRPGRRQASLVVEDAQCDIYKTFDEARSYLTHNIDWVLDNFGDSHHIAREDVMIIVGTLTAQHYAMMVSDFSPRTTIKFNVHAESARGPGEPWGTWSFVKHTIAHAGFPSSSIRQDTGSGASSPISPKGSFVGPLPRPSVGDRKVQYTCKVSNVSASPKDAVLLAKLRFAPGEADPTLYP